ncbi:Piso0_002590 [Millerozyma farinosa CBS 7064]|uniref:Piso0_002590 protein n=1 Tax=Pichia sorbitophila (strain ATCC MYA-4447 / BCRC 22081 / CBS 7064 / NBRC 10061 / NRRL Y-12695) TaxID=559304 RepID=G8YD09_PICSO|nr:Piso0_002590 [Millerozyma farinosa CBS 7064]
MEMHNSDKETLPVSEAETGPSTSEELTTATDQKEEDSKTIEGQDQLPVENQNSPNDHTEQNQRESQQNSTENDQGQPDPKPEINESNSNTSSDDKSSKKNKKRLTLQERLALAAKGKKTTTTAPADNNKKQVSVSEVIDEKKNSQSVGEHELNTTTNTPSNINSHPDGNSSQTVNDFSTEGSKFPPQTTSSKKRDDSESKRLHDQMRKKDETIAQLMEEGQKLSVKELKLNEAIKKLKASNTDLESSLQDYSKKLEENSSKLRALESFLSSEKLKSLDSLKQSYTDLKSRISSNEDEHNRYTDLESKYDELKAIHEEEFKLRVEVAKELEDLKIHVNMLKNQHHLEIKAKETIIEDYKEKLNRTREDTTDEIARLESKIEDLRIEKETLSNSNSITYENDSHQKASGDVDFANLSRNHEILQKQYLVAQENWKLLESNLLKKIEALKSLLDQSKKTQTKLSSELLTTRDTLENKSASHESLLNGLSILKKEKEDLMLQNEIKANDVSNLQSNLEKIRKIYNSDLQKLQDQVKKLKANEELSQTGEDKSESISGIKAPDMSYPEISISQENSHVTDDDNMFLQTSTNLSDINFGESSRTPALSQENSGFFDRFSRSSVSSIKGLKDDSNIPYAELHHSSRSNSFSGPQSGTVADNFSSNNSNSHILLINKMSSNIKRLEVELNTLRDENQVLVNEKERAQQEFLKSLSKHEEISSLQKRVSDLESELKAKSIKEQTMLELIGEKSEKVEELTADVQDLKEIVRSQVQEIVSLQTMPKE